MIISINTVIYKTHNGVIYNLMISIKHSINAKYIILMQSEIKQYIETIILN